MSVTILTGNNLISCEARAIYKSLVLHYDKTPKMYGLKMNLSLALHAFAAHSIHSEIPTLEYYFVSPVKAMVKILVDNNIDFICKGGNMFDDVLIETDSRRNTESFQSLLTRNTDLAKQIDLEQYISTMIDKNHGIELPLFIPIKNLLALYLSLKVDTS